MRVFMFTVIILFLLLSSVPGLPAGEAPEGKPLAGVFLGDTTTEGRSHPVLVEDGQPTSGASSPSFADLPVVSEELRAVIAKMNFSETIRVIIQLKYQPQELISKQVSGRYEAEMEEIRQRISAINTPYAEQRKRDTLSDADNYLDPALYLSVEDKDALRAVSEDHEALSLVIRDEIAVQLRAEVEADQQSVRTALEKLGGTVEFGTICVNTLVAVLPVMAIDEAAAITKVARISEDECLHMGLTNADNATRITDMGGLWDAGETGGIYDPAVLDTGIDLTHPGLDDEAGRTNFYTWYLVAASGSSIWDDETTQEDLQGHGTHVMGIVASMGTSLYPSHLGMAHGADKVVTLKAGYRDIYGGGRMFASDAMWNVDRALYDTGLLRPFDTFNDDIEGINLSFWGETTAAETDYSRFYDSVISSYPDLLVTLIAGNGGPDNSMFSSPGMAYNPITVAIVDDGDTTSRVNDVIDPMSTRGPTADGRRKPDIAAPGTDISSCNNLWETELDYIEHSGTSMAAPMVQGVAMDLMDAGVYDELELKALLLNTAQKNDGTIYFENDADGWDPAYGWGYMNTLAAYHHRTDLFKDTVTSYPNAGHYHLYKGQMRDEGAGGEGRDRATMVWNRPATYAPHEFPTTFYELSDLNLYLFEEADNNLHDYDVSTIDNVAQVRIDQGAGTTDVIINTLAWDFDFPHGGGTEEFALATEEDFVEVDIPSTFQGFANWPAEMEPNEEADFIFWVVNNSEIASHNNTYNFQPPPGWVLVSGGADPFYAGSAAGGGYGADWVTWRLRAQPTPEENVLVGMDHTHYSYFVEWGPVRQNVPVDVRWDTTPPSPAPTWSTAPYAVSNGQISMSCTETSDLHEPVYYYFDYYSSPTGGYGGDDYGWTPALSWTDSGLSTNHQYSYRVAGRDSAQTPNSTGYTAPYYVYTLANTPGTPSVTNPTNSTLDVTIQAGGNPAHTECAIWVDSWGGSVDEYYLNASGGSNGLTPFWQPISSWGTVTATGLDSDIQYGFAVVARNGDDITTGWSSFGLGTTTSTSSDTVSASITCLPASGTVPFATQMTITLDNLYPGQIRRVAARMNVTLAGGAYFPNWRGGYTNLAGGASYVTSWNTNLPALGSVIGSNQFQLVAVDVTPTPYNLPPYPPAGDSDTDACTVVANSP